MNPTIFMVDTRGGVKTVPMDLVEEKKVAGWFVLPQSMINERGLPKQTYFPQYDHDNKSFSETSKTLKPDDFHEVLIIETF